MCFYNSLLPASRKRESLLQAIQIFLLVEATLYSTNSFSNLYLLTYMTDVNTAIEAEQNSRYLI
jgi:hypothetical protein